MITENVRKQYRLVSALVVVCLLVVNAAAYEEDFYIVQSGGSLVMDVAANDVNHPPTSQLRSLNPTTDNGNFANAFNGKIEFLANSGFSGFDTFRYDYGPFSQATRVYVLVGPNNDNAINAGEGCGVGQPVNVTTGNMWLKQRDYLLPGFGDPIEVTRFYNSITQANGLFGSGWTSQYDDALTIFSDGKMLRLSSADGRSAYFGRMSTSAPFTSFSPAVTGNIVVEPDLSYTLTFKDGRKRNFSPTGKLLWQRDRNGNQTTLNYDVNGLLTGITDAAGRVLGITLNANGNVAQVSDTTSVVATYEYYPSTNWLKTVTYNDGSKYQFEYDATTAPGKILLTTVKDALDNILETHAYDSQGRATTSERHGGVEKYTLAYDQTDPTYGPFTNVTDANGNITKYFFKRESATNLITRIEGACSCSGGSQVTTFEYDTNLSWLNLTNRTDALGRQTTFSYDNDRNVTQVTDVLGTQSFTYNSLGQVLTYKDRVDHGTSNNTVTNVYDPGGKGNLVATTNRLGHTTTLTYTSIGQLETITDARNKTTTLAYDSQGRLIEVTDANNKDTTFGYDARARITSTTNAKNETTTFEYDLNSRLKKIIFADANYVEHTYDLAGRKTATRDPRGYSTIYAYDNAYRLTSVTDPLNHARTFGYDMMSNLTSQTDALGNTTNFEYDDFNRLEKVIYPPASVGVTRLEESVTFDQLGNVKTRVDTAGRTTSYDYDTSNRLTKITDALTNQTQFEYNLRSQLTKVTDPVNQEYVFTYDPVGRTLSQTRAGTTMSYEYDAVGNRTKRTDYNGTVTNYTYDDLNRLTSGSLGTYTYDDLSRILTATNSNGTVSFTYDNRGRVDTTTDVYGKVIDYDYDANGNRVLVKLDGAAYAAYTYDPDDKLSTFQSKPDNKSFNYYYDAADRLIQKRYPTYLVSSNQVRTFYSYDGMSRLTALRYQRSGAVPIQQDYTYNSANQISQIAEATRTRTFTYDNLDRLTAATDTVNGNESYSYDAVGNRLSSHLSSSYTNGPFNRLTATQTASYTYDNNGSMTSRTDAGGTISFVHDSDGRMLQAYSNPLDPVEYKYDALGRRVSSKQPGQSAIGYTFDGDNVLLANNGGTITTYRNGPGIDNKLRSDTGSTTTFYLPDPLGTTIATAGTSGSFSLLPPSDSFGNGSSDFTGREYDNFTELYYYRARMYDPQLGRFTSEDPIGFAGGDINLYGYVRNNPINSRDPFGLYPDNFYEFYQNPYDVIPERGWIVIAHVGNYSAGFADRITLDATGWIRRREGIDDVVDKCSWAYSAGGWTATSVEIAAGGYGLYKGTASFAARQAANSGLRIASPAGGEVLPGSVLRMINKGESVASLIDEAKTITHLTGNEVAAVSLQNGQRVLVQGGAGGIDLTGLNVRRILGHTQPTTPFSAGPVVPSGADIGALQQLGQRHSYIYERGQLIRFGSQ